MNRRTFTAALAATPLAAAKAIPVGVLTEAGGPHIELYLEALAATPEAGVVTLSDPSGQTEPIARKLLGAKLKAVYKDHAELLAKEKPTMALVSLEARVAPPVVARALDAGAHVMAEKPSCVNLAQFRELARKADANKRHLALALANRVDPVVMEAKRLVDSGLLGKIYSAEIQIAADQTRLTKPAYHKTWFAQKNRAGGGFLIWIGIHWIDLTMYLTGSKIRDVAALEANVGGQPLDVEDAAVAVVRFEKGFLGSINNGYFLDKGYHSMIKLWGSDGWLEMRKHGSDRPLEWYSNKEGKVRRYAGPLEPTGYTPFIQKITRAFAGLEPPPLTTADSLHVLEVVYAAYDSAASRRTLACRGNA